MKACHYCDYFYCSMTVSLTWVEQCCGSQNRTIAAALGPSWSHWWLGAPRRCESQWDSIGCIGQERSISSQLNPVPDSSCTLKKPPVLFVSNFESPWQTLKIHFIKQRSSSNYLQITVPQKQHRCNKNLINLTHKITSFLEFEIITRLWMKKSMLWLRFLKPWCYDENNIYGRGSLSNKDNKDQA